MTRQPAPMKFCCYSITLRQLLNHEERKFVEFMKQYINETLPTKKGVEHWSAEQLIEEMKLIGSAYPVSNYWIYRKERNKILLLRTKDNEAVLWVSMAE